jgi:chromate reductase
MKLLMVAASLRKESFNKKLIDLTASLAKQMQADVSKVDFADFNAPLYNADIQDKEGFPQGIQYFIKQLQEADGFVLASPEYNYSTPGVLKNLIDWVSRISPMPWRKKPLLLISASPSLVGGHRGLWHTRVPLEGCGAFVYPDMFCLASAHEAFALDGQLKDSSMNDRLKQTLSDFIMYTKKLAK